MQINGVTIDSADRIVLTKDIVGSLLVVGIGSLTMSLSLFGELMSSCSIPSRVRVVRLVISVVSEHIDLEN